MFLSLPSPLQENLDCFLESHYADSTPGIIVSVEQEGQTLYERALGLAEVETNTKITAETNFRMASLSKQFTAMGISLLEQQGLLSYHTPLPFFFPEVGAKGQAITLFHLLTHTSGLPDYEGLIDENRTTQVSDQEVLQVVSSSKTLLFQPGSQFRYSNTGYVLLGLIIEKATGFPFASFLQEKIFSKAGMKSTSVYNSKNAGADIPHRAMGYAMDASQQFHLSDQSLYSATQADGCIYTSLKEYRRWQLALTENPALAIEPLLAKVRVPIGSGFQGFYGMGWFFAQRENGSYERYHTGNSSGFSHLVVQVPAERIFITAFSNVKDNPLLLPELLQLIIKHTSIRLECDLVYSLPHLTR